jgi:hypothetical protein
VAGRFANLEFWNNQLTRSGRFAKNETHYQKMQGRMFPQLEMEGEKCSAS